MVLPSSHSSILSFLLPRSVRACAEKHPSGMLVSKPGDHQLAHRQIDERLTTGVGALKIA